jgi:hypothetical protein
MPVNKISVNNVIFKLKRLNGEYTVQVTRDGKRVEVQDYFTDDKQDAYGTLREMAKEEINNIAEPPKSKSYGR